MTTSRTLIDPRTLRGVGLDDLSTVDWDFNDTQVPWFYQSTSEFMENYPSGWPTPTVVPIQTGAATFRQNVLNTLSSNGRCLIELDEAVYHLTSFEAAAGDPMYAFGFWDTRLVGFIGKGPDKTVIQMDANSLSSTQRSGIAAFTAASWGVLNIGMMRIDGDAASPAVLAGVTVRAADQQIIPSFASDNLIVGGQPAPHRGVTFFRRGSSPYGYFYQSHVRYQGAARAATSRPPFESANFDSQYSYGYSHHVESDGRRSPELDAARPRRCGVMMGNNEQVSELHDVWLHHSNVSRYAVNDENRDTSGLYLVERVKAEQITVNQNRDPALNGGASLGGWTNATPFGWESCNGTIRVQRTIISQDNPNPLSGVGQIPMHFQMTHVGDRNPVGGRFYADDNEYRWPAHPHLDGFAGFRISQTSHWWLNGSPAGSPHRLNETIFVTQDGVRLQPAVISGTWPPTLASLTAAGITPHTHYLVRSA